MNNNAKIMVGEVQHNTKIMRLPIMRLPITILKCVQ